jgi:diguanylate cyclase (GGDEF)-like protein
MHAQKLNVRIGGLCGLMGLLLCWNSLAASDFTAFSQQLDELEGEQQQLSFAEQQQTALNQWTLADQARFWHRKGLLLEVNDRIEEAKQAFITSIGLFEQNAVPDPTWVQSWQDLSYMKYLQTNDPEQYCPERERALELARALGDPAALASSLTQRAYCFQQDFADFSQGLALLNEAAAVASEHGLSANLTAIIHNATGNLYRNANVADKAYGYYQQALQHWMELEDHQDVFNMRHNLVGESIRQANWNQAEQHISELKSMADALPEFRDFTFFAYFNAARTAYAKQEFQQALADMDHALELAHTTSEQYFVDQLRAKKVITLFRLGQHQQALTLAREYLQTAPTVHTFKTLNTQVQAIEQQLSGQADSSITTLWALLDQQEQDQRSFIQNAVAAQSSAFDRTLETFQKQAETEKQLAIKELELERQTSQNKINQLTLLVAALAALVLLIISWFLYRSKRNYQRLSQTDVLTGVANRRYIINRSRQLIRQAGLNQEALSLSIIDIDDFKSINDMHGHAIGDEVIKSLTRVANEHLSAKDAIGRIGGEEFMLLLPGQDLESAAVLLNRIRQQISATQVPPIGAFTISGGCVLWQPDEALESLMKRADQALYQAKSMGKNQIATGA